MEYENTLDYGIEHRKTIFFFMKIQISAIAFYWRNDTHYLCHLTVFIPKLVSSPSLFILLLGRHITISCLYFQIINFLHWLL